MSKQDKALQRADYQRSAYGQPEHSAGQPPALKGFQLQSAPEGPRAQKNRRDERALGQIQRGEIEFKLRIAAGMGRVSTPA